MIQDARIVPPTSQNQGTIEEDLVRFAGDRMSLDREALTWQCEQAVRNHDPASRARRTSSTSGWWRRDGRPTAAAFTVIGIGNRFRHDDAAGLEVARRVRRRVDGDVRIVELEGEPIDALDVWSAADEVIVADAVAGAGAAGTVHLDASDTPIPAPFRAKGTHTFSLADVVELARATERLPHSLLVYGIEGGDFSTGEGLTEPVARAVEDSAAEIVRRVGTR